MEVSDTGFDLRFQIEVEQATRTQLESSVPWKPYISQSEKRHFVQLVRNSSES